MTNTVRPQVQQLESRCLLANNVLAAVVGGDLYIVGDGDANQIKVVQLAPGTVAVVSDLGTTVNCLPADPNAGTPTTSSSFVFTGVTGDVTIALGGGDDNLALYLDVGGDLTVVLGEGGDFLDTTFITSDLPTWAQPGRPGSVTVGGDTLIYTDGGGDLVTLSNNLFQGDFVLSLGGGDDSADLSDTYGGDVFVDLGGGTDSLFLTSPAPVDGDLTVRAGGGDDFVALFSLVVEGDVDLNGGTGANDTLLAVDVIYDHLRVQGFETIL